VRGPDAPEVADLLATKATQPLNILLVDDHEGVRATTAALLEDLGHKVTQAGEAAEILDRIKEDPHAFDLIVSDYAMPRISGAELVRQARQVRADMPAIIITGYADAQSIARRPDDVLVLAKPFTLEQMSGAVRAAVTGKGELTEAAAE
jgi:CheY-like chemotaxis protein